LSYERWTSGQSTATPDPLRGSFAAATATSGVCLHHPSGAYTRLRVCATVPLASADRPRRVVTRPSSHWLFAWSCPTL